MRVLKTLHLKLSWLLVLMAPVFIVVLFLTQSSPVAQFRAIVLAALLYLVVAFWYHVKDKTLTFEIIIEYILIAALALVIL